MLNPPIDQLVKKVGGKYKLVEASAARARQMHENHDCLLQDPKSLKDIGKALEEIDQGLINIVEEKVVEHKKKEQWYFI